MREHLPSKGNLLTPALKDIRRTTAKCLLQWLFTDEKLFTVEEQFKKKYKIYAQMALEVRYECAGGHHPSYVMAWYKLTCQDNYVHFCVNW
jgi:hypothetical protein